MVSSKEFEIIDLTVSSPAGNTQESTIASPESQPQATPTLGNEESTTQTEPKGRSHTTPSSSSKRKRARRRPEGQPNARELTEVDLPSPPADAEGIFFFDTTPIPLALNPPTTEALTQDKDKSEKLLLPAHVSVFGSTPVEILAPATSQEDDSIQFLDYDDGKVFHRYWEDQGPAKAARVVCKHCGAEGEHKTYDCPVVICLTCGVRDEHPTRSCPISKVCFSCGMKGHINATCPNRGVRIGSRFLDCERCSSTIHKTNECPTWWRMYAYLSESGQAKIITYRNEQRECKLGEGGEGYIADDQWCYSCGNAGHLGDDCEDARQPDYPEEHSAFSFYNTASGPFYDPDKENQAKQNSKPRRRSSFLDLEKVPDDVGRRGKDKAKSRLGKMVNVEDEPDDWFNKALRPPEKPASKKPKTIQFSESLRTNKGALDQPVGPSKSSLLERLGLGDSFQNDKRDTAMGERNEGSKRSRKRKDRPREDRNDGDDRRAWHSRDSSPYRPSRNDHNNNSRRDRERNRDREKERGHQDSSSHRPRYRGGYSR